jgi:hypothetical protein
MNECRPGSDCGWGYHDTEHNFKGTEMIHVQNEIYHQVKNKNQTQSTMTGGGGQNCDFSKDYTIEYERHAMSCLYSLIVMISETYLNSLFLENSSAYINCTKGFRDITPHMHAVL